MERLRVRIEKSDGLSYLRVAVDDVRLVFENGRAERNLPRGRHRLTWTAIGNAGDTYRVCVERPQRIECCPQTVTLDEEGIDHSFCKFDFI